MLQKIKVKGDEGGSDFTRFGNYEIIGSSP